jgi:YNFM family putative membrane transporter
MRIERETRRAAGVFVAGFLTFFNLYTPQAFLQILAADLGVTPLQVGLSITATLLAVSLIAPVAGALSDRFGRKRLIVGAIFTLILPTLMVARSGTLSELLVWRFVQGLLLPFIFTVTVAYIADECSGAQTIKTSGLYASGTILGGFLGRFVGGIVADLAGWRAVFVTLALITASLGLFVVWAVPREERFRPVLGGLTTTLHAYGEHIRNRRLLATCGVGASMLFTVVACFTFVNFRLAEPPFLLSPSSVGSVFAVYLVGMLTTPLATRVAVRVGRMKAFLISTACAAAGLGLTLLPSLTAIVVGLSLVTGGLFVVQALALGFIGVVVPHARSSAVGLYVTIYYIGGSLGGVAPGGLWHHQGWIGVVALLWAVLAAMTALALRFWRLPAEAIS